MIFQTIDAPAKEPTEAPLADLAFPRIDTNENHATRFCARRKDQPAEIRVFGYDNPIVPEAERQHILRALRQTEWRIAGPKGAAAILGMKRTTLQARMRKLGVRRPI